MNKKVMIYAYTEFNLGDDLFIKVLCERYPNVDFYLYAKKGYEELYSNIDNLTIIWNNRLVVKVLRFILRKIGLSTVFSKPRIIKNCDAAVYIGGSLFIQNAKWKEHLKINIKRKFKDQKFFLLGSNFGPYSNSEFYTSYKGLFSKYTDICFRDSYSFELFNDLPNVRKASDIIFQLDTPRNIDGKKGGNIVISVIRPSKKQSINLDNVYFLKIKELIIYLIDKGYSITLMSFCKKEEDEKAIDEILKIVEFKYLDKITSHYYRGNIDKALAEIMSSSLVIATRFHSMILGWLYNKPVYPIVYSKKMKNVMDDIGFTGDYIDIERIDELDPINIFESINKNNKIDVRKQQEDATKHFEKLDEYLF